ncbi:MAG: PDZ domain-containing protein [Jatrophihabitans sp.]|nr:MAG: PDZ domain-containing protein [Jatrophihabitans sp.]
MPPPPAPPSEQVPAPATAAEPPARRRPSRVREYAIVAVVAAVIGGGIGAATVAWSGSGGSSGTASGLLFNTSAAPQPKLDGSIPAAAARISPSVVTIDVTGQQQADTGSGVIIRSSADGSYVLTNNHVIAAAASGGSITVVLADGRSASATVTGADVSDDLAVVKIGLGNLTAATFAPSSTLIVGQSVVAVGAPLGLSDTVTAGIVSNTARPVQTGSTAGGQTVFDAIQTDAAINPGNSGGPLVNLNGDVVGINAAIATAGSGGLQLPGQSQAGNIGIGFAIPSDEAARIAAELIATGRATHAMLGVTVTDAPRGAAIRTVTPGSPAASAGLQPGDVVTTLGAQRIGSADDLVAAVRSHAPGQTVKLGYDRGGSSHTVSVHLGSSAS